MDTMFMNSENSKTSDPHRLLLNLSDKINLKKVTKLILYQFRHLLYMKNIKKPFKNNKFINPEME